MNITFANINNALKTHYGPAAANQVNTEASPIVSAVKTRTVGGEDYKFAAPFGVNGGAAFLASDESLPDAGGQKYVRFTGKLCNLYGVVQFTDKAMRAASGADAFFNVAKQEFESLVSDLKIQLGRSIYGEKTGKLCTVKAAVSSASTSIKVDSIDKLVEGQIIDINSGGSSNTVINGSTILRITSINTEADGSGYYTVTLSGSVSSASVGDIVTIRGAYNNEMDGLNSLFGASEIYGVATASNQYLLPSSLTCESNSGIDDEKIFKMLVKLSDRAGAETDMIVCGSDAYLAYAEYLKGINKRIESNMELKGGWKGIGFNFNGRDIRMVMDRFCDKDTMMFLETKKMTMYQMGDFEWMDYGDGSVIQRLDKKPIYQAAMSRYCQLVCEHPGGLGRITNCSGS